MYDYQFARLTWVQQTYDNPIEKSMNVQQVYDYRFVKLIIVRQAYYNPLAKQREKMKYKKDAKIKQSSHLFDLFRHPKIIILFC